MAQGNTIIKFRVEPDLESRIINAIERRNEVTRDEPDSVSSWIRRAVEMRLDHLERGRGKRAKGVGDGSETEGTQIQAGGFPGRRDCGSAVSGSVQGSHSVEACPEMDRRGEAGIRPR